MSALATPFNGKLEEFVVKGSKSWQERRKALGFEGVRVVDPELTSMAVNYIRETRFVHEMGGATPVPSNSRDGTYGLYDPKSYVDQRAAPVSERAPVAEGRLIRTKASYHTVPMGFEIAESDLIFSEATPMALLQTSIAQAVSEACGRTREIEYANLLFEDTAPYNRWGGVAFGVAHAAGVGDTIDPYDSGARTAANDARKFVQWSDKANARVMYTLARMGRTMFRNGLVFPNLFVMGAGLPEQMIETDDILNRVNQGQTTGSAMGDLANVQAYLNRVWNGADVQFRTMNEISAIGVEINEKDAWLGYVDPAPTITRPTALANFYWQGWKGSPTTTFDSYTDQKLMSRMYRGVYANQFAVVAKNSGILLKDVIA